MKHEVPIPSQNSDILNKVEALLNKANGQGVTEAEAKLFFAKAAQLMAKHGIEQHQLGKEKPDANKIVEQGINKSWRTERPTHWWVRNVIRHCFHVSVIRQRIIGVRTSYYLIGTKEDCAFASYAFDVLNDTFLRLQNEYLKKFNQPRVPRVYNGYFQGLAAGFCYAWDQAQQVQMKEQKAESYALVLVDKDKAVDNYIAQSEIKMKSTRRSADEHALQHGVRDGMTIKLNKALKDGDNNGAHIQ